MIRFIAGSVNLSTRPSLFGSPPPGQTTALADIARLMDDAAQGKSRYVRIADRAARLYAPAVHALLHLSCFVGWMIAGAGWHHSLLIAALPCLSSRVPARSALPYLRVSGGRGGRADAARGTGQGRFSALERLAAGRPRAGSTRPAP
jgi:hypothetical protein